MPAREGSRTLRYAFFALLVTIVAIGALVSQRRHVARSLIEAQLRGLGLEEVGHEVERFGWNEFGIKNFRIGGERGLSIDRVDASYSPSSLLAGRLDDLHVRGVRLRGALEDGRFTFGALDPALEGKENSGSAPLALPARNITIEDVEVEIATPDGPFAGRLAGALRELDDGDLAADLTAEARHSRFVADAALAVSGRPDAISGGASLALRLDSAVEDADPTASLVLAAALSGTGRAFEIALGELPFRYAVDSEQTALHAAGTLPPTRIAIPRPLGSAPIALRSVEAGGKVQLAGLSFALRDLAFEAALDPDSWLPTGELTVGLVSDLQRPARIAPFALAGTAESNGTEIAFGLNAEAPGGDFAVELQGVHDVEAGAGEARIDAKPLRFAAEGLQPVRVSPLLAETVRSADGVVDLEGILHWTRDESPRAAVDLVARDLDLETAQGDFEAVNTAIHFDGPAPWSTPPQQLISMARVDLGLELSNGLVSVQLRPDGRIAIESAEWSLADGKIRTRGVVDLEAPSQKLRLRMDDLDLARLLELADLDGLSGSGRLSGELPIVRRGSTLLIQGGKLAGTDDGGWVRYGAGPAGAGSAESTDDVNVVFKALENFQYEVIEAGVDGDTDGPVTLSIRLLGANPDFLEGHPIDFTLNVESHLADLLRKESAVQQIPDAIRRRIEAMSGGSP